MPWERKEKEEATKTGEYKPDTGEAADENADNLEGVPIIEPPRKKRRIYGYKEDPFVFFNEDEPIWRSIQEFYNINENIEEFKSTCLLTRCAVGKKKNLYFCTKDVKELVKSNESSIKIINTGVRVFARCDNRNMRCEFRLANEGLASIGHVIGEARRIIVSKEDLIIMLNNTDPTNPPGLELLCEETRARVQDVSAGSCLLIYKDESFTLSLVGWRGTRHLRAYTDLNDAIHMLRMLGADVSKYDVNKFKKKDENDTNADEPTDDVNDDTNGERKDDEEADAAEGESEKDVEME